MNLENFYYGGFNSLNDSSYEILRLEVYSIIDYLNQCIKLLDDFDLDLSSNYIVDDCNVHNITINSIRDDLLKELEYLKNNVIPSLNNIINN